VDAPDYGSLLAAVRRRSPLVLCLTNYVTVTDCANALLAVGASPVMSDDPDDARDLAAIASALVINIGTISSRTEPVMDAALAAAKARGIPVVLDPVGAGATPRRLEAARKFAGDATIIRGNASEILALAGASGVQKGVDSSASGPLSDLVPRARALAGRLGAVVAATGETDVATDGETTVEIPGGHVLLTRLTGTGCLLSALAGAYAGATPDAPLAAAAAALKHLAKSGELAAASLARAGSAQAGSLESEALGSFKTLLFDRIATLRPEDL
jgi:hydroxyethylthiazole kinase